MRSALKKAMVIKIELQGYCGSHSEYSVALSLFGCIQIVTIYR